MRWHAFSAEAPEICGYIPTFLSEDDPRPAWEQFNANYAHGGGWKPFGRHQWTLIRNGWKLKFPGDPPLKPVAMARLRDELILIYPWAMVMILQQDGSYEISRMD